LSDRLSTLRSEDFSLYNPIVIHYTGELDSSQHLLSDQLTHLETAIMSLSNKLSITDVDLKGKRVLIRV
jgi:hypothetical protein